MKEDWMTKLARVLTRLAENKVLWFIIMMLFIPLLFIRSCFNNTIVFCKGVYKDMKWVHGECDRDYKERFKK